MIEVIQTCDNKGCGEKRSVPLRTMEEGRPLSVVAEHGGWREVREGKHLCVKCINAAIK